MCCTSPLNLWKDLERDVEQYNEPNKSKDEGFWGLDQDLLLWA